MPRPSLDKFALSYSSSLIWLFPRRTVLLWRSSMKLIRVTQDAFRAALFWFSTRRCVAASSGSSLPLTRENKSRAKL
jgi:hypothetical protein